VKEEVMVRWGESREKAVRDWSGEDKVGSKKNERSEHEICSSGDGNRRRDSNGRQIKRR
jgi:hypothetical protein